VSRRPPAVGAGASTVVPARGASAEPPASAPDAGQGSVEPSGTTGCGGASDPPPGALSPSWGPEGTEPSRGAPSSSSSTMIWGVVRSPPGAWDPLAASDPPRAFDPSGISIPPPTGGSRRPPPPRAHRANACLPHPLPPRPKSRENRAEGAPPSQPRSDSWWRSRGTALSSHSSPSCPPLPSSAPRSGPDSWPGAPCPLGLGAGSP